MTSLRFIEYYYLYNSAKAIAKYYTAFRIILFAAETVIGVKCNRLKRPQRHRCRPPMGNRKNCRIPFDWWKYHGRRGRVAAYGWRSMKRRRGHRSPRIYHVPAFEYPSECHANFFFVDSHTLLCVMLTEHEQDEWVRQFVKHFLLVDIYIDKYDASVLSAPFSLHMFAQTIDDECGNLHTLFSFCQCISYAPLTLLTSATFLCLSCLPTLCTKPKLAQNVLSVLWKSWKVFIHCNFVCC